MCWFSVTVVAASIVWRRKRRWEPLFSGLLAQQFDRTKYWPLPIEQRIRSTYG